jgi:cell division control protein 7
LVALDNWSAGVVLLSLITRQFPFFQSNDDQEAVVEVACLLGAKQMKTAAETYNRRWRVNIPSIRDEKVLWSELVHNYNRPLLRQMNAKQQYQLWDFCDRIMDPWYETRMTAAQALQHPFLMTE